MNKKEIKFLKNAYKKEKDGKIRERILMNVYILQEENIRNIGERLNCTHPLVLYWKNRYEKEGLEGLKTKSRSGKPTLISRRQEAKIKAKVAKENPANPWTTKKICELIKRETGVKYTQRHVQRILHKWDFNLLVPRQTFWQKASGEEIKNFWKKNQEVEERKF